MGKTIDESFNPIFYKFFLSRRFWERNLMCWAISSNEYCSMFLLRRLLIRYFDLDVENITSIEPILEQRKQLQIKNIYNKKLKKIDKDSIKILKRYFDELDGTLLKDLVYKFISEEYDIFH